MNPNPAAVVQPLESAAAPLVHLFTTGCSNGLEQVAVFLAAHPRAHLHFTPTDASWLNQVELRFSKVERDVIVRGVFTSTRDLAHKLRRYIDRYNRDAKPFQWTHADPLGHA